MPHDGKYDAIVVLGNRMDARGVLNAESADRLSLATKMLNSGDAPMMVTCGWAIHPDCDICIADAMFHHAVEHLGADHNKIAVERNSRDTVGDAVFVLQNFAIPRHWRTILVVTSDYHVARAEAVFSYVFGPEISIQICGVVSQQGELTKASEEQSMVAFYQTFAGIQRGDAGAIWNRMLERHPFYNGAVHPSPYF